MCALDSLEIMKTIFYVSKVKIRPIFLKTANFFKSSAISVRLLKERSVVKIFIFLFLQISWEPDFEPYLVLPTELVPKYVSFL